MADGRIQGLIDDVRRIVAGTDDPAQVVGAVEPLMRAMAADTSWVRPEFYEAGAEMGVGIVVLHEEPADGFLVETICWMPGRGVAPHDHQTWGIVVGLDGRETNVDWRRRDDGSRPGYADIEKARETVVGRGVMKTFMPNDIHSIRNDFDTPSLSLHVYGRNLAQVDRSEFSPLAKTQLPCPKRPKKQASPMAAATAR